MAVLDIFAVFVLVALAAALVGLWVFLAVLPGRIARSRDHPQADAIAVCGWWGALTLGVLMPLAFVWAYTKPSVLQGTNNAGPPSG